MKCPLCKHDINYVYVSSCYVECKANCSDYHIVNGKIIDYTISCRINDEVFQLITYRDYTKISKIFLVKDDNNREIIFEMDSYDIILSLNYCLDPPATQEEMDNLIPKLLRLKAFI